MITFKPALTGVADGTVQSFVFHVSKDGERIGTVRCKDLRPVTIAGMDSMEGLSEAEAIIAEVLDAQINESQWYAFRSRSDCIGLFDGRDAAAAALAAL